MERELIDVYNWTGDSSHSLFLYIILTPVQL
jgi:hypothetical protein